ncbi:hypothetical protein [Rhizobium sp. L43]|nr:hypothetical protein [Rhizobium sp. L43]
MLMHRQTPSLLAASAATAILASAGATAVLRRRTVCVSPLSASHLDRVS